MKTEAHGAGGLNSAVAGEIRAELARRQWSQTELAARLGVDPMWLSRRLRAVKPLTLTEFEAIARALELEPADLLPRAANLSRRSNLAYSSGPARPKDGRPNGRAKHRKTQTRPDQSSNRRTVLKRALTAEELDLIAA